VRPDGNDGERFTRAYNAMCVLRDVKGAARG
jgi:hypothetical protein